MASSNTTAKPLRENYLQEYKGDKLIAVAVTLMVLEVLCVGLRFIARRLSKTAMGLDDWLIGPSFVFCFGLAVLSICTYGNLFIPPRILRSSRDKSIEL